MISGSLLLDNFINYVTTLLYTIIILSMLFPPFTHLLLVPILNRKFLSIQFVEDLPRFPIKLGRN